MKEVSLPALEGTNPLGFLAALGVLDALGCVGREVVLRWTDELVPHAVIGGIGNEDDLVAALDYEREAWNDSLVLGYPARSPLRDAKPDRSTLRDWYEEALTHSDARGVDMLCALVAEGALDGNGNAKPTHLHFTAGQQRFLEMVRTLGVNVDQDRLREALYGPWAYDSPLPTLAWDVARGERVYAIRATNPSGEKRLGVPGADWLAFRGLVFYPVYAYRGSLRTTGCNAEWKRSAWRWPLWSVFTTRAVARSLVADPRVVAKDAMLRRDELTSRGLLCVLEAPIRRTDQGGYGSFGGPEIIAAAWGS